MVCHNTPSNFITLSVVCIDCDMRVSTPILPHRQCLLRQQSYVFPKYQVHIGFSLVPLRWVRFCSYWFCLFHFMVTIVLTSTYLVHTLHCILIGDNFVFLPCVSCYCCTSISTCLSLFCVAYSCYFLCSSLSFSIEYIMLQAW